MCIKDCRFENRANQRVQFWEYGGVTHSIPAVGNSSWYPVETMKQDDFVFRIQLGPTLDQGQTAQLLQLLKWAHGTHTHTPHKLNKGTLNARTTSSIRYTYHTQPSMMP